MSEIVGTARLGKRTKDLVKRLKPGDLAIIDHVDLDRVSAEELVESGVRAVVNVAPSNSGRFPNPGPLELVRGGVCLIDAPGSDLFEQLSDGETVTVRGRLGLAQRYAPRGRGGALRENARRRSRRSAGARDRGARGICGQHAAAPPRRGSAARRRDRLPPLATRFRDRHAVVVARGPGYKSDLRIVRPYIRNFKPVLVAVDGGADALLEIGLRPDVIVGDFDSVTDAALASGAELLVHAYEDGRAPGAERLKRLGLPFSTVSAPGISEDIALLLAHERGAELIVAVGTHFNLVEFLERNRDGMASTFVTRLKVGESLVDAKGVSRLVSPRVGVWPLVTFVAAGVAAIAVAVLVSPALRNVIQSLARSIGDSLGL